jgi:CRISPR-associated protein Cas5t
MLNQPPISVVLRTVWRIKKIPLGSSGNTRPDYQQLLTGIELVIWLDSSAELGKPPMLEDRIRQALHPKTRSKIIRFGGLSLGESTHLVDTAELLTENLRLRLIERLEIAGIVPRTYLQTEQGLIGLPVWVDHVGSSGTMHVIGDLTQSEGLEPPPIERIPQICPPG